MAKNLSAATVSVPNANATPRIFSLHDVDPAAGGGVDAPTGSLALRTDNGAVYAKIPGGAAAWTQLGTLAQVFARIAFSGSASDLETGTVPVGRLPGLVGDVLQPPGSNITTIADDAVTGAKLRNSLGTSVIGRSGATAGDPEDIVASVDGQVLRRAGGTLGFGTLPPDLYSGRIVDITVSGVGGLTTDWNPFAGDAEVTIVRASAGGGIVQRINGLAEGTAKRRVLIFNVSPGPQIIFTANSGAAGNQIFGPANTEIPVFPGSGRVFWYDATSPPGVWRLTERL